MTQRFTEEQISLALAQAEEGVPIAELCRKLGVSAASFYSWRKKHGRAGRSGGRKTSRPASQHLNREDWVAAARKVLVKSGIDDVKVDQLARQIRVTRGSFYWHFKSRQALLDALLQDWEARNHAELAEIRERWSQSTPDLSEVVAIWLSEDPGFPAFDMAVRIWARKSSNVAQAVRRVDNAWIALLTDLFRYSGFGKTESLVRARIAYFHQVGYYALAIPESIEDRLELAPVYYQSLTGREPGPHLAEAIAQHIPGATPASGKRPASADDKTERRKRR